MTEALIQAVEVVRHPETGYWSHPGMPDWQTEDPAEFEAWLKKQGLYHDYVLMQGDSNVSESHPYWSGEMPHCIGWEPERPEWADNAFLLSIFDTEEGPAACWVWRA